MLRFLNAVFAMFIKYLGLSPVSIGAWRLHHLHFMTRSIFDPTGNETEHSGNRFTPPDAAEISQMPVDVTDGKVEEDEKEESIEGSDETAPPGKR